VEQRDVVRHTVEALEQLGIRYAIVGSLASMAYGEARLTRDMDVLVELSAIHVAALCSSFPAPDWYLSPLAVDEAVRKRTQFNAIHTTSGNKVDFIVAQDDEWGRLQLARRRRVGLAADITGFAADVEDVILGKLLYYQQGYSDKHLRDIAGMLAVSREEIDLNRLTFWAKKLGVDNVLATLLESLENPP
jgi:hypothetical protein